MTRRSLIDQTRTFSEIRVDEVLSLIRQHGIATNRGLILTKMEFQMDSLNRDEQSAIEDEKVVQKLLADAREHSQQYVLGVKEQAAQPRNEGTILDQGLFDSLLANDSYSFLIRRALDAGLKVKHIQAEQAKLSDRYQLLKTFPGSEHADKAADQAEIRGSIGSMESAYKTLITNIRHTQEDFANQEFGDSIRQSDSTNTEGRMRSIVVASGLGFFLGAALGMGCGLLGVYVGEKR